MKNNFLIISNSRSGSTWLTTALGQLDDVSTDFELKIPPITYQKLDLHYLIEDDFEDNFFPQIAKEGIRCSKLVLDPKIHTLKQLEYLQSKISKNTKFIFLKRSLVDQVISEFKIGFVHQVTKELTGVLGDKLLEYTNQEIPQKILNDETITKYYENLNIRLSNDLFISNFLESGKYDYITVDYENLDHNFLKIKEFLNSQDEKVLKDVTVTKKLNCTESLIESNLKKWYKPFDKLRDQLLDISLDFTSSDTTIFNTITKIK